VDEKGFESAAERKRPSLFDRRAGAAAREGAGEQARRVHVLFKTAMETAQRNAARQLVA
jgi:hypothetical protein